MSMREDFPGNRGGEATQDVASLLADIALISIEPFGTDNPELSGLPQRPVHPVPDPFPVTQLSVTQHAYNAGIEALGMIKRLEDAVAGCKARMVARVAGAAAAESDLLALDRWQDGIYSSSAVTEMALTLGIPERTAASLEHHSTMLVEQRPRVLAALEAGSVSWRHATIINDEIQTLQETETTTANDAIALETRLLVLSENTTANSFAGKARRAREKMHPETIKTRTKDAFTKRNLNCDAGKDGMSWLNLYLPTISASAIYTRCTRLARALKAEAAQAQREADKAGTGEDCLEHRTLNQLRADIAAILLMGQELPVTGVHPDAANGADSTAATPASTTCNGADNRPGNRTDATPQDAWATDSPVGSTSPTEAAPWDDALPDDFDDEEPPWAHSSPSPAKNTPHGDAPRSGGPENSRNATYQGTVLPTSEDYVGDGSGLVGWTVDGIKEDPSGEYQRQLETLAQSNVLIDPPLPEALVIVTVPFMGLLGLTDEPAELAGPEGGPIPADIARQLLGNCSSFLRVLTDPINGEALPLDPQRYTLRAAEKTVLQSLTGSCYVPNCPNPVMDTELDHLRPFEFGGASTMANLRPACKRHHTMKHFKDDKNRRGQRRCIDDPERANLKLRGWTPKVTEDGRVGWVMPSGTYQPPHNTSPQRPQYPKWLKKLIDKSLRRNRELHS